MLRTIASSVWIFLLCPLMFAQQAPASQPALAARPDSQNTDRDQIQKVLTRYQTAYEGRNMVALQAIWPGLQIDQKQQKKLKREFDRADISSMKIVLEPQDMQFPAKDEAIVKSKCNQQYIQVVSSNYYSGDNQIQRMVGQAPGPANSVEKKSVKKTTDLWMTLHRDGDSWTIVSVSDKKPH